MGYHHAFTPFIDRPFLITLHTNRIPPLPQILFIFNMQHNVSFVSISDAQRRILPAELCSTIHHGIDLPEYAFNPQEGKNPLGWRFEFQKQTG